MRIICNFAVEAIILFYLNYMNYLFKGLLIAGCAAALVSCSEDSPWANQQGSGRINLKLHASGELVQSVAPMTRATETVDSPEVTDFSVSLNKNDESYSRTWNSLSDFAEEESFPTGVYTITAFYGDVEGEGFEKPYFEGSADVTVLEARTTDVSVEASLANCLVSIGYTEAFKSYFSSWSATVHSEGNGYHDIEQGENRPVYIIPGNVDISLEFTSQEGKTTKVQPTTFVAEPKHRYHLVYDVNNGKEGEAELTVIFDDTVEQETINIELTDELFTTPPPEVIPSGFVSGESQEALEGSHSGKDFIYNVICRGRIYSADFTVNSSYTPSFGNEIDLCQSTASMLKEAGLDAKGFVNNPDRLASLNVSDFVASLPVGHHELTLVVKDRYTRVSEPVTLVVENVPTELTVTPIPTNFGTNDASIEIAYNGNNPQKNITIMTPDDYGSWYEVEVKSVKEASRSRAFETKNYIFTFVVSDTERDEIPVKVFLRGVEKADANIPVIMPKYTIQTDAYSNKIALKIVPENNEFMPNIIRSLRAFVTGSGAEGVTLTRNEEAGMVWINGVAPATKYSIQTSLSKGDNPVKTPAIELTTEPGTPLPSNNFSEVEQTIFYEHMNSGGQYKAGIKSWCYNSEEMNISEPTGWSSLNQLTCYSGSSCLNTWFMVPSTFAEDGKVVVRSVAYDHNGTEPESKNWGTFNYTYYNPNLPANIASRSAGELFLGSYSYNGSESKSYGIPFSARPASLSFDYTYLSVNNEKAVATITVFDADNKVLGTATADLDAADSETSRTLTLPAYSFGSKAAKLQVIFRSTKGDNITTIMPESGNIDGESGVPGVGDGKHLGVNASKSRSIGSVLTLSNVKLNY